MIEFIVEGLPATQGSKKHVGNGIIIDSCKRLKQWRNDVAAMARIAMRGQEIYTGAVAAGMIFHLPRPKSHYGTGRNAGKLKDNAPEYPIGKPDLAKMQRAVEDAMKGIVYKDDSQIVHYPTLNKYYAKIDDAPGVWVRVMQWDRVDKARW